MLIALSTAMLLSPTVMSSFIAPDAKVEKIPQQFIFTEGPVWVASKKHLLFTDIPANKIYSWDGKEAKVWRDGTKNSNGLTLDKSGNLYSCEHSGRALTRTKPDGTIESAASTHSDGKKFNSPNDVAIHPKTGLIVFTDPSYGLGNQPSDYGAKWVFSLETKSGKVEKVYVGKDQPNGVVFSPDGKHIYIADSGAGILEKFDWKGKEVTTPLWSVAAPSADGIRVDVDGNIWAACTDGVRIYAPDGALQQTFKFPESPANLCFAEDGKTLYVTARRGVYWVKTLVKGVMPGS
ncbi:MAG TPA: SMP-30/gluconolactonase/LRE family protein [Fimbriimonas sp.]|nr:SMP-30/gluconolactonase/LRE family protein [Fimbriimonas sp.]